MTLRGRIKFIYLLKLKTNLLIAVIIIDASMAHQKFSIKNPSITLEASNSVIALITNKNKPMVNTVIGKVSNNKIGFTM